MGIDPRQLRAPSRLTASVIVLCTVMLVAMWGSLWLHLRYERERILRAAERENDKVARIFEEHVVRTMRAAELTLREIESEYARLGRKLDLVKYAREHEVYLDPYTSLNIVDENGRLALSSVTPFVAADYSKNDNVIYHRLHATPQLFISRPREGAQTKLWSVFLSHRINKADGSYGGNSSLALDPFYFTKFYGDLDFGRDAVVVLHALDGIVRARIAGGEMTSGQDVSKGQLHTEFLPASASGVFRQVSPVDGVTRLYSYRKVKAYPLVVLFGTGESEVLAEHNARRRIYLAWAAGVSVVVLLFAGFAIVQLGRQAKTSAELRDSEARFRGLTQLSSDMYWEHDRELRFTEVVAPNSPGAGERSLGKRPWEIPGNEMTDAERREMTEIVAARRPFRDFVHRFAGRDGGTRFLSVSGEPRFDERGEFVGYRGTAKNITAQKRADASLRESEQRFRDVAEATGGFIWETDLAIHFTFLSDRVESVYGYSPQEMLGRKPADFMPPGELNRVNAWLAKNRLPDGSFRNFEQRVVTKHGKIVWQLVSRVPIRDAAGSITGYRGTGVDITEKKRAEAQLEELNEQLENRVRARTRELEAMNKELATFNYSVSHDLRAPLRSIEGYSRLLLDGHADKLDADGRRFLQNIAQAALQMGELTSDLLEYSRLEHREMQPTAFNLRKLIEELLAEHADAIRARGATVNLALPERAVLAYDREGLAMALRNLLENALKFSRDAVAPVIEIGAREQDRAWQLWVRDNGIGFDMQYHERIFEIFRRLHAPEKYPGTGVGLAIVAKAMERMGGRVWAESAPGKGATFYLEIRKE